jgi:hypothetical protein
VAERGEGDRFVDRGDEALTFMRVTPLPKAEAEREIARLDAQAEKQKKRKEGKHEFPS